MSDNKSKIKLFKNFLNRILGVIFVHLINFIASTWRIRTKNATAYTLEEILDEDEKCVFVFWHNKMLPAWYYLSDYNVAALVSQSKDGSILTSILELWGVEVIRGSSSKGGKEALELLQEKVRTKHILMTPDGPRGPIYKVKPGCLIISAREKSNIILVGVEIKEKFTFKKSWDKFEFPLPFSKIIINFEKIEIIPNDDRDFINSKLEEVELLLNKINKI